MVDLLKNIIDFLIHPMNVFWSGIGLYFLLNFRKSKKAKFILYASLFWLFITGTGWLPDLMVYGLEKQYHTLIPESRLKNLPILVLGGGSVYDPSVAPQERLLSASRSRFLEGVRLYYLLNEPLFICSGYSARQSVTQAAITKEAAEELGIPAEKIRILEEPATTQEEANYYKRYFGEEYPELILVTSDIHMPRAVKLFRKAGLRPLPAPADHILLNPEHNASKTDFKNKFPGNSWWISDRSNFQKFYAAMHEYLGLIWSDIY